MSGVQQHGQGVTAELPYPPHGKMPPISCPNALGLELLGKLADHRLDAHVVFVGRRDGGVHNDARLSDLDGAAKPIHRLTDGLVASKRGRRLKQLEMRSAHQATNGSAEISAHELSYAGGQRKAHLMAVVDVGSRFALGWAVGSSANRKLALRC